MPASRWQAYLINLASAEDRLRNMQARLRVAGIPYERIEAIRGRDLPEPYPNFDEPGHRKRTGRRPIPAEIGCYLSHLEAIDAFLATDHPHGLILEDDAVFAPDFVAVVEAALEHAGSWDVLRLQTVNRNRVVPARALGHGYALGVNLTRSKGAAAYMLSRRAAEVFRRRLRPMQMAYDIAFDIEYFWGLRAVAITPYPVTADADAPTQIQVNINAYKAGLHRYLTVFPFRAAVETARVACRLPLLARLVMGPGGRRGARDRSHEGSVAGQIREAPGANPPG
jgi:glycosyl transferase family 25